MISIRNEFIRSVVTAADDRRDTNDDNLMRVLLINFSCRYMESVLQPGNDAFYDHSLFLEAVHPRGMEPKCHYCNSHDSTSP